MKISVPINEVEAIGLDTLRERLDRANQVYANAAMIIAKRGAVPETARQFVVNQDPAGSWWVTFEVPDEASTS